MVVDKDSRFDAPNLDGLEGVHWTADSIPGQTVPLDGFMRDYYQPRLAEYVLSGQPLKGLPDIADRNLFQADVRIRGVVPDPQRSNQVSVVVEVSGRDGDKIHQISDLKLFRDGRLVAAHSTSGSLKFSERGLARVVFDNVPLPTRPGPDGAPPELNQVTFKAYAFNEHKVRSRVDSLDYAYQPNEPAQQSCFL